MTRADLAARLRGAGIEEAREEALRLFCHFSGYSRAAALAEPAADCADPALAAALARRLRREPLAYILGECWFCNACYRVGPACLIPRPETEMLVEYAQAHLPPGGFFADLCTGSGCIAVSLLACRPDARGDAYELSPEALALASENALANRVDRRLRFYQRDLLLPGAVSPPQPYDMILSNPPYVRRDRMDALSPEVQAEPRLALDGGEDGGRFYAAFLHELPAVLAPHGCFVFEIGEEQGAQIRVLAEAAGFVCRIFPDLAGLDRMAVLCRAEAASEGVAKG